MADIGFAKEIGKSTLPLIRAALGCAAVVLTTLSASALVIREGARESSASAQIEGGAIS